MAGIGFELRKILSRDSYTATLRAYVYAGSARTASCRTWSASC